MFIFSHTVTSRFQYAADFIGKEVIGVSAKITTDIDAFEQYSGLKINYSNERLGDKEFFLKPSKLLFEKDIRLQQVECFELNSYKAFFKTEGDFPFDIFAASFYLLSRYEEYLPHKKDMYGRYAHENSLAYKEAFLDIPLINIWIESFKKALKGKFPGLNTHSPAFQFIPTYDIDEAYAYSNKGFVRTAGGIVKSLINGEWTSAKDRVAVLSGKKGDPYDSYNFMDSLHKKYNLNPRYFFHVAVKKGKYDKNIAPFNPAMQQLIRQHAEKYDTGIHPSWKSGDEKDFLSREINLLKNITGKAISSSRQHYIRLTLPQTFRELIKEGIREEFSMGYGSINGFRASVASPFYWYDLEKELQTELLLYPFCYMEANSFYEQKFSAAQALEEMRHYYKMIRSVNGTMITIWHNHFLGCDRKFSGWKEIYEQFLLEVTE